MTDEEIALSLSTYFAWAYPDYMRQALALVLCVREKYIGIDPNKELTYRRLREIIEDADSFESRMLIAANTRTTHGVLNFLAHSADHRVVLAVAENPNTHVATLTRLVRHESAQVRIAIGEHASTPDILLRILAADANPDVRLALAENQNMPIAILEILQGDENPYVAARAERSLANEAQDAHPAEVVTADFRSAIRRAKARR